MFSRRKKNTTHTMTKIKLPPLPLKYAYDDDTLITSFPHH